MIVRSHPRAVRPVRAGFTLLEVLVVVAILVILASVLTFATTSYLSQAKYDQATIQAKNIQTAAMSYYAKSGGNYPPSLEYLVQANEVVSQPLLEGGASAIIDPWGSPFQFQVMMDAAGAERFVVMTTGPNGQPIQWPRQ